MIGKKFEPSTIDALEYTNLDLQTLNPPSEHSFTSRSSTSDIPSPLIRMGSSGLINSSDHHHVLHHGFQPLNDPVRSPSNHHPSGHNQNYLFQSSSIDGSSASPVSSTSSCTIPDHNLHSHQQQIYNNQNHLVSNQNQIVSNHIPMVQIHSAQNPTYGMVGSSRTNPHPISSAFIHQQEGNSNHSHHALHHPLSIDTSNQEQQKSNVPHHSTVGGGGGTLQKKSKVSFQDSHQQQHLYYQSSSQQSQHK